MVSRLSVLMIQNNEVLCEARFDKASKKWEGWIYMLKDGEVHTPIINTCPYYSSRDETITAMNNFVDEARKINAWSDK